MTKASMKRFSLLGLVLIAASAVATAVIPTKSSKVVADNGNHTQSTDVNTLTCGIQTQLIATCDQSVNATDTSAADMDDSNLATDTLGGGQTSV